MGKVSQKKPTSEEVFEVQPSTLENIDWAFFDWVDKELDLFCNTQNGWEKTPVIWTSAERSYHIKNNKDLRDMSGTLELPLISVKRDSFTKSLTDKGPFFANLNPDDKGGVTIFKKKIKHEKTANHRNEQSLDEYGKINFWYPENRAKKVLYEYINMPQPVYLVVNYKISIKASHIQQMNTLIRPFLVKAGGINYFVFGREGHKYEGFLPDKYAAEGNSEKPQEEERFFKTTILVKTIGYIMGAGKNDKTPKIKRGESIVEVKIPREYVMLDWNEDNED